MLELSLDTQQMSLKMGSTKETPFFPSTEVCRTIFIIFYYYWKNIPKAAFIVMNIILWLVFEYSLLLN